MPRTGSVKAKKGRSVAVPAAPAPMAAPAPVATLAPVAVAAPPASRQYLTFIVDGQEYGIEIHLVREIRGYSTVTVLPNMPRHIKGLLNVRGTVIPVFDLRAFFGLGATECTRLSVIVTVLVGERLVGLLVDSVSDVLEVGTSELSPPPDMGKAVDTSLMTGLAAIEDRLLTVLRLDKVVGDMLAA